MLSSPGFVEFDFFVDSEEEHDFFEVRVDGVVKFSASGRDRGGSAKVALTSGAHSLRFAYSKDAQGSAGQDTAWLGRVRIFDGSAVLENHVFSESPLGAPSGFVAGGSGGGFQVSPTPRRRALRRPVAGAFVGYQPARTISSVQRTIEWPAGSRQNDLLLSYYIDSEANFDFLRVYVDGQERFATSGPDRTGRMRINVGAAGPHTIEIAYDKDPSVDVGTDDVRILDFQATSEFGTVQFGGFESAALDTLPTDWSTGAHATSGLSFAVGPEPAGRIYAQSSTSTLEPDVDGIIAGEYSQQSIVKLPNLARANGKPGELWLETQSTGKRFFAIRVPQGASEPLSVTLLIDQGRVATMSGKSCGSHGSAPSSEDRALVLQFPAGLGEANSVTQSQGTCGLGSGAWQNVPEDDEWVVEASASEPLVDPGHLHVEIKVVPPSSATVGDWGLGVLWNRGGVVTSLPRHEGSAPELDDAATWETIRYAPVAEIPRLSLVSVDGQPRRGAD